MRALQRPLCGVALSALCATGLTAQYSTDFEGVTASATGTVLTMQDGYYLPNATSVDFNAFTYTGNVLGVPANPTGGNNFIGGTGPAGGIFARAQRDLEYGGGSGVWTVGFDVLVTFTGVLPTAQNAGSFSIQPFPGSQSLIALARWTDPTTAANWNADYVWFDAAGTQLTESVADPGFQNLAVNTWYRWETDFNLTTNQVLEVRIIDIVAATSVTHRPAGRYLLGGTGGSTTPTGLRWFGGGSVAGNTLCFDNGAVEPRAGYTTGFEVVTASAAGTTLTGQDGYYLPNATSVDFVAHTYAGNTLGLPANPTGGNQFIAGTGPAGGIFARAQRDISWGCARGRWTVGFDIAVSFTGTLPTAQNAGSVSIQPFPGSSSFIALARWTDPTTAANWNADFVWFDAAGTQLTESVADPRFQLLAVNTWYRWEIDFDLTTNEITEVRIHDIAGATSASHQPMGRYLLGGTTSGGAPTGLRFFGGGSVAGNTLSFDNAVFAPEPAVANVYAGCGGNPPGSLTVAGGVPSIGNTLTIALDNPVNTQNAGAAAFLLMGLLDITGPCGTPLPGFGMSGPAGELLIGAILPAAFAGPAWAPGTPSLIPLAFPNDCGLIGGRVYCQGILIDPMGPVVFGLTDAIDIRIRE